MKRFISENGYRIAFFVLLVVFIGVGLYYFSFRKKGIHFDSQPSLEAMPDKEKIEDQMTDLEFITDEDSEKAMYFFSIGEMAGLDNNTQDAILNFKRALQFDPESYHIHARLGEEYMKRSEFELARKHLNKSIELNKNSENAHIILGSLNSAEKKYDSAVKHYKKVISLSPEKEQSYILLSTIYAEQGKYDLSVQTLKDLIKQKSESFLAYYYLGRVYADQDKHLLAEQHYKKALDIHPMFKSAARALGLHYERRDKIDEAVQVYFDMIERGSKDPRLLRRAIRLLMKKKEFRRVITLLEQLKRQDPEDLSNRVRIGLIYFEMKKYKNAKHEFEELLKDNPDSDRIHYYLSAVYEKLKDFEKVLSSLDHVKPRSLFYSEAIRHRVRLLTELKRHSEAMTFIQNLIKKNPEETEYYDVWASIYEDEEKFKEAVDVLKRAIEKFPKEERLLYYLGIVYDKMGQTKQSVFTMKKLIKINPNHADALNFVGYTYATQNRKLDEAERLVRKAMKLKPGHGYIEDSLGWIYYVRGKYDESLRVLKRAVSMRPNEAVIVDHLGDTYLKLGQVEKAYDLFNRALTLKPDKKTKVEIEKKIKKLSTHERIKKRVPATKE